jgi:hypothetical protein
VSTVTKNLETTTFSYYSEAFSPKLASICLNNFPLLLDSHMESITPLRALSPTKAPAMMNPT